MTQAPFRHHQRGALSRGCRDLQLISCDIERKATVTDILIRDVPEEVVAEIDAQASRLGISRVEFVRRQLVKEAQRVKRPISVEDLRRSDDLLSGLRDEELMRQAWS